MPQAGSAGVEAFLLYNCCGIKLYCVLDREVVPPIAHYVMCSSRWAIVLPACDVGKRCGASAVSAAQVSPARYARPDMWRREWTPGFTRATLAEFARRNL